MFKISCAWQLKLCFVAMGNLISIYIDILINYEKLVALLLSFAIDIDLPKISQAVLKCQFLCVMCFIQKIVPIMGNAGIMLNVFAILLYWHNCLKPS